TTTMCSATPLAVAGRAEQKADKTVRKIRLRDRNGRFIAQQNGEESENASRKSLACSHFQTVATSFGPSIIDLHTIKTIAGGRIGVENVHVGSGAIGRDEEGPYRREFGGELNAVGAPGNTVPGDLTGIA